MNSERGLFVYDYVVYDSEVEREFAQKLDQRDDVRLFVKLPEWFKVETPVGTYNPDWAIVKHHDETVYLVRETKGTKDFLKLRTAEADTVRCGQRHFEALGVPFAVVTSANDVLEAESISWVQLFEAGSDTMGPVHHRVGVDISAGTQNESQARRAQTTHPSLSAR